MVVKKLAPSEIRYSQNSISNRFRADTNGIRQHIGETLDEIVRNPDTADRIPNISVFNKDGKWFALDNRRLWVFKKAEELGILSSIDVYVTYEIDYSKFTTPCDGKYVRVRRNNPGGRLWQSLRKKIIEKQAREERHREEKKQKERERQQRERKQQKEIKRQHREREQQMEKERQQKEKKQQEEREQQRREREQMQIDQQGGGNIINIVIDIISFIVRIFRG